MINDCFYYGVYTPDGYFSLKDKQVFCDVPTYIVEGNSNAVRQKLYQHIISELKNRNMDYTEFCTADGCEGIYSKDADFRVVSDTECAGKVISLINFQDIQYIDERFDEIEMLLDKRDRAEKRIVRFLSAAQSITDDAARLESRAINVSKVNRFATKLWQRKQTKMSGKIGMETKRFVSCPTRDGVELNMEAFDIYCDKITVLQDKTGACSRLIVDRIRKYALSQGFDVISCLCPMNPGRGAEHIIIPELRYGIFVSKYYHRADFKNSRRIFAKRFISDSCEQTKHRMEFSLKAYRKMMDEVFASMERVHRLDRDLDCIYYAATDMDALNKYAVETLFKE